MGMLVAKAYPTKLFLKAADHTYVECGTGARGWRCWGGKTGGTELRRAAGSTKRADAIATPSEKAGITCYLINGVCHQAANRILLPAGITVRGARGYSVSEAMFGTYGRLGVWPCRAPFNQRPHVSGDLPACVPPATASPAAAAKVQAIDERDWIYSNRILALYADAGVIALPSSAKAAAPSKAAAKKLSGEMATFHLTLFKAMCEYRLGPTLDRTLERKLMSVRRGVEKKQASAVTHFRQHDIGAADYVDTINKITIQLQTDLAGAMSSTAYERLLELSPSEEPIVLADPAIVAEVFKGR